ncbi:glycosyltransferase family 4 protein [Oceanidesulfovibrio marinus]|uniref:Glycosyltransferase family 1 protein n=1 Tax=Oceanidesulfovibrio marinus TaxID=370038 RepID=A0A6P1ZEH8_9BACT|nr:glycosyltransferase family 4 protein [Oceanidesulfovibrio marinus]TVM32234.1 glycosyltransferase family 1 protein [Oceanidesulfovibrio marinus]
MNILMLAINDPAGTAIAFTNAINRYTEHTCRLVTKELRYTCMFEKDLHEEWLDAAEKQEVGVLMEEADIFHFHMTCDEDTPFCGFLPRDFMGRTIIVHHHHGHPDFRGDPVKFERKYDERARINRLVSTPDLLKLLPGSRWQPNIVPIHDVLYLPRPDIKDETVQIAHAPTRKELKNTAELLHVLEKLKAEDLPFGFTMIENKTHAECLRIKRRSQIVFDHLQGYFGISSLESLSQGRCVVAGLDDWNRRNILEITGAERLPWFLSSLDTLEDDLRELILNHETRMAYGHYARTFMETYWNEQRMISHLIDFYESCAC